ncbi:uncharacterized protein LOC112350432 isoform X1 [Selaginella moellendorffii]|uniref:uncharacterized protein LOC112350432 isoform X1 n=1 Tax=Selaginella moellendorffii TaxID=88036 RepID=UPI000D1C3361|nr:uncharacterized protein LOC112350432 isoform X1 [Selaginella moellendorffii]|eukprot:XP_024542396.1 uncharacterized protein LOC112350432 isoform X1 [Selaginella moellendorffii]
MLELRTGRRRLDEELSGDVVSRHVQLDQLPTRSPRPDLESGERVPGQLELPDAVGEAERWESPGEAVVRQVELPEIGTGSEELWRNRSSQIIPGQVQPLQALIATIAERRSRDRATYLVLREVQPPQARAPGKKLDWKTPAELTVPGNV